MDNKLTGAYCISMPHRHTVIYSDNGCEISFEIEINDTESVVWEKSIDIIQGHAEDTMKIIDRLSIWLSEKFPDHIVIIDNS